MSNSRLPDLAAGGSCAWQLPPDESGPAMARSLLEGTMTALGVDREVIEDGKLAVSETATNALRHGRPEPSPGQVVPPELWTRTVPAPQLVISVFDTARVELPRTSGARLLDDHGKGLDLLNAFTAEWDSHPSRSRLALPGTRGKTVRFALPLPTAWPGRRLAIPPVRAAHALLLALRARGIEGTRHSDEKGISVLELPGVNVWIGPKTFSWQKSPGRHVQHPLLDLQETAEHLIRHVEEVGPPVARLTP